MFHVPADEYKTAQCKVMNDHFPEPTATEASKGGPECHQKGLHTEAGFYQVAPIIGSQKEPKKDDQEAESTAIAIIN